MKRIERKWMYERLDSSKKPRIEFLTGVSEFIEYAKTLDEARHNNGKIRCPCVNCDNVKFYLENDVKKHLIRKGFCPNYYDWVCHGENFPPNVVKKCTSVNPYRDMVEDALRDNVDQIREEDPTAGLVNDAPNPQVAAFFEMLANAEKPVFEGSDVSLLEAASRVLAIKCEYNLPHKAIDSIASLITDVIPVDNSMSQNFYQTKKLLKALQLPHQKIHACPSGCMIYWKDADIEKTKCDKCKRDRYKPKKDGSGKQVPRKVLIYFPIGPRLQRLYATKNVAQHMRWHSTYPRVSGTMAHPSDTESWKQFDQKHPDFAKEPRNVRLGLCTDGFAPFGQFGKSYSCWPVMLTPYNLPPEFCMKKPFIFLSLLVPGPCNPKNNLDVYLQPLIHELKELWETGIYTYDVSLKQNFDLRVALMWTINDFPAYGMLSGWGTAGEHACPYCMKKSKSFYLKHSRKICWFDCHRQFLPLNHPFRKNRMTFRKDRKVERDSPPPHLSGEEIWEEVRDLPTVVESTADELLKLKKKRLGWWKRSIFWDLPYWKTLSIRHNLDVMHIEKNFFEQLINTIMDVKNKTTYGPRAKLDLDEICAPRPNGKDFVLNKSKREILCNWVSKLKFPDGYASDLNRCVDTNQFILRGLKSHDCHVFMERLLPVALKYLMPKTEWSAITEISQFFRDLCASTITEENMIRLEKKAPEILCKLEKIFPPSFFNSMEHLPIHLAYEAKVGGPVQYRWMYPFERFLNHLKQKIGNKAHVESSICNAYLLEEISNFCSTYFEDHIDTRLRSLNLVPKPQEDLHLSELFRDHKGVASGKCTERLLDMYEYEQAHKYILSNCETTKPYEEMFQHFVNSGNHTGTFSKWFKSQVKFLNDDLLEALAKGPSREVRSWNRYTINGFNFRVEGNVEKASINNGVCVGSTNDIDYYGTLVDIVELSYNGAKKIYKTVLFKCNWIDNTKRGTIVDKTYKLVEVNSKMSCPRFVDEPFVLSYQVSQAYYTPHPNTKRNRADWLAAFKMKARSNIEAPVNDSFFQEDIVNDSTFENDGDMQEGEWAMEDENNEGEDESNDEDENNEGEDGYNDEGDDENNDDDVANEDGDNDEDEDVDEDEYEDTDEDEDEDLFPDSDNESEYHSD